MSGRDNDKVGKIISHVCVTHIVPWQTNVSIFIFAYVKLEKSPITINDR